jgi:gamma-glutamyl-gamma-aminobutyrate hydrolase PuuD
MRIAIPASKSKTQFYINQAYIYYLFEAGYEPHLVCQTNEIEHASKVCDGLLLPGGGDIDPIYYGADNDYSFSVDPEKDAFERELFHTFREKAKPVFGICRGLQLIALEFIATFPKYQLNGSLDFLQNVGSHNQTSSISVDRHIPTHLVEYVPAVLYGGNDYSIATKGVNSMHHQCLYEEFSIPKPPAKGQKKDNKVIIHLDEKLIRCAWSTSGLKASVKGTIVEAFRIEKWGGPIFAVQWHPEELRDYELLHSVFGGGEKHIKMGA